MPACVDVLFVDVVFTLGTLQSADDNTNIGI